MASYYKLSLTKEEEVIQNDKSEDKKFFSNTKIKGLIEQDPAAATAAAYLLTAFPLYSNYVTLKNIIINKRVTPVSSTGIRFFDALNTGISVPHHKFKILVGLSDQPVNAAALDIRSYNSQNHIFIPCFLSSNQKQFNLSDIGERFALTHNRIYLNIFTYFEVDETGDQTTFYTDVNAIYAAKGGVLTIQDYIFDLSVFISGRAV